LGHGLVVIDIDRCGNLVDNLDGILQGTLESGNDDNGVDIALELRESLCQDFTS
jgi:hypothetical protein